MHNFAPAGGMSNVHGVFEIEMFGQRREIISIMIHVMTACCLSGATVPAAIMRWS